MSFNKAILTILITFLLIGFQNVSKACSMYKLTVGDKTMVGCNEDAWRTTSSIWFESAKNKHEFGAGFTGSRKVSTNQLVPQSGMNEVGLVFSRLASYYPKKEIEQSTRKKITNEVPYLTDILHKCKTVDEVKSYIGRYDHSFFIDDIFIYVDNSGHYLIVEPYNLILGSDSNYILSNFCPSITDNEKARKLERYRNGEDFLSTHKSDSSLRFCTALSDTMHVCRNKKGDGTLLTSIWDLKNGLVNLYFYHNYDSTVQFNLTEELAKGDHIINIPNLFPNNYEFEQLASYITPFNTPNLRISLVLAGGLLVLLSFLFLIGYFRTRNTIRFNNIRLVFSGINVLLAAYLSVLATNINIYYFDAPYQHYSSTLISISSYIPFLILLFSIPLIIYTVHFIKNNRERVWTKSLIVFNNLMYVVSILGFGYWGLFAF